LTDLAAQAEVETMGMDFKLLYDGTRKLLHIGYNVTIDQLDTHHYDLLASEARLASYLAIVKRDIPESHWFALGRPMTKLAGAPGLLSWGGTMFEYLMPTLLMRSGAGTLLARTEEAVIDAQIAYARRRREPWGISESAYARLDAGQTYQYRAFGVPGLGFKRGIEDDRVSTPYASLLAASRRPRSVAANVTALKGASMLGTFGMFDALDSSADAHAGHTLGGSPVVVRSYMAHHQGMILVALGNLLNRRSMVDRFHSDARVESGEFLLNEHAPESAPAEWPISESSTSPGSAKLLSVPAAPPPWSVTADQKPQAFVLGNGQLTSLVTATGAGGLFWHGLALTRYVADGTHDEDGIWIYVRDEESRALLMAASPEDRVTYSVHKAECNCRREGISVHVDVAVAAADDVEIRLVTLRNETDQSRVLSVTSAGRPVLMDSKQAATHPVFSSMFVESEWIADIDGLLFARRPQKLDEEPAVLVHRLVREGSSVSFAGYESERGAFFGRGRSTKAPAALSGEDHDGGLHGSVGPVLDPIMSLMARVVLKPKGVATMAFVTSVAPARSSALEIARKYGSMHAVRWALRDAEQEAPRRLFRTKLEPRLVATVQRLFSALLFGDAGLRASSLVRSAEPPCQERLWGRGISGDDPIVLIQVDDPSSVLLPEVLSAQRFLRSCGVRLDLVLIDRQVSGYVTAGAGTVRGVLADNDALDWLDVHGGIFVVSADQVPEHEVLHLEAAASVVLRTTDGSLDAQLRRAGAAVPSLPRFEATLPMDAAPIALGRPKTLFDNGTGGFSEDGREYVVEVKPGAPTPAPWCNVLANPSFGCLVSESSLGSTWSVNSGENRLTPWRNDPLFDPPSEALYLRDEETAAVWSTTPLPAGQDAPTLVRHGAGYTTYERHSHGLLQEMTVFVPPDSELKVVRIRIKNTLGRHRRLTATYYAEWVLGSQGPKQRPYIVSEFNSDGACLLVTCQWNKEFAGRVAFLASRAKAHSFTAGRSEFLGLRGDYARPEALERWALSGRVDVGADPCAALQVHLDLEPGEEAETHFLLGQAASRDDALAAVARFREGTAIDKAWAELRTYWDGILEQVRVKTPEPAMDLMLNRWLLYQTLSSRIFGRTAFYQSSGAFGYRDQLQDVLALLQVAPEIARAHILEATRHQFEEGDVLHWWHPPSGRGVRTRCSDDMAWLPYVTSEYVDATGDVGILDESVPFLAGAVLGRGEHERYATYATSTSSLSLYEHCLRSINHAVTHGKHDLPLMGDGDWNDGMNRVGSEGRGESVWLGWFLSAAMDRFASLAIHRKEPAHCLAWRARAAALRTLTKNAAWDGGWYLRAYHDDGSTVGSAKSRECRIDSIAQSWAVLGEERDAEYDAHARAAVHAADEQLIRETDRLVLLFWPPFDGPLHDPGYIRAYPPGVRENGGQYTHGATWLGVAYAALGEGSKAARVFRLLNPIERAATVEDAERYRVEPYVIAGDIYSCPPWTGRGGWTWYTGSAAWMWRLGVESILGIRREGGKIRIDPCIPPHWPGYEAWIREGDRHLHVIVENPAQVSRGVLSITVDGQAVPPTELALPPSVDGMHEIVVRLGSPSEANSSVGHLPPTSRTEGALEAT
jgi:cyclic beta-1,2-glucan synthetase